jgi:hypothetical protein
MSTTVGIGGVSVKREQDSQRVKTAVLGRFYAGFVRRIDLLASEFCKSREFHLPQDLTLFVLNPVTPGLPF